MLICGIDPGAKGALAFLSNGVLMTRVMPDANGIADLLSDNPPDHVFVEKAQSFPGQGVSSAFNYGRHFGEILGVLITLRQRHTLVTPQMWARALHVGSKAGDAKARSLEVAKRLWPGFDWRASARCKIAHDGQVDAALIAEWGRRQLVKS